MRSKCRKQLSKNGHWKIIVSASHFQLLFCYFQPHLFSLPTPQLLLCINCIKNYEKCIKEGKKQELISEKLEEGSEKPPLRFLLEELFFY